MRRRSQIGLRPGRPAVNVFKRTGRQGAGTLTSSHELLTSAWTADVERLETAIDRFTADRPLADDCRVQLFEIPGDAHLHVNVTHHDPTVSLRGWAGPGRVAGGFVHNRRFVHAPVIQTIRHIRNMVFAART
jgi:hypothetical protein